MACQHWLQHLFYGTTFEVICQGIPKKLTNESGSDFAIQCHSQARLRGFWAGGKHPLFQACRTSSRVTCEHVKERPAYTWETRRPRWQQSSIERKKLYTRIAGGKWSDRRAQLGLSLPEGTCSAPQPLIGTCGRVWQVSFGGSHLLSFLMWPWGTEEAASGFPLSIRHQAHPWAHFLFFYGAAPSNFLPWGPPSPRSVCLLRPCLGVKSLCHYLQGFRTHHHGKTGE